MAVKQSGDARRTMHQMNRIQHDLMEQVRRLALAQEQDRRLSLVWVGWKPVPEA